MWNLRLQAAGFCFILWVTMMQSSCKEKHSMPSAISFAGKFTGVESCNRTANLTNTLNITVVNDSTVNILNLYGLGKSVVGHTLSDSCIIAPQLCDTVILQGFMMLSADTLRLNIIAASFGNQNVCNAMLIRQ